MHTPLVRDGGHGDAVLRQALEQRQPEVLGELEGLAARGGLELLVVANEHDLRSLPLAVHLLCMPLR